MCRIRFPETSLHLRKSKKKDISCDCSFKEVLYDLASEVSFVKKEVLMKKCEVLCDDNSKLKSLN